MSLHKVDKSSGNRGKPVINADDLNTNRKAHAIASIVYRAEGVTGVGSTVSKNDRTVVHDGTTNRIVFGLLPDGTYGLVISNSGVDVLTLF